MYDLLKRGLFLLPPERAHVLGMAALRAWGTVCSPPAAEAGGPELSVTSAGLRFAHPLVLAAGFDKDAEAVAGFFAAGFAGVEVGTVTPRPQPGNPSPRLFRIPEARALINRMGFNNHGAAAMAGRLRALGRRGGPVGVNLGKNKDTPLERAVDDYVAGVEALGALADYLVVNASSPNTPGLRQLQQSEPLRLLLSRVKERVDAVSPGTPLFLKIAPDLAPEDLPALASGGDPSDDSRAVVDALAREVDRLPPRNALDDERELAVQQDQLPATSSASRPGVSGLLSEPPWIFATAPTCCLPHGDGAVAVLDPVAPEDLLALLPGSGDAEDGDRVGRVSVELQAGLDDASGHDVHPRIGDDRHHHGDLLGRLLARAPVSPGHRPWRPTDCRRFRCSWRDARPGCGPPAIGQGQRAAPGADHEAQVALEAVVLALDHPAMVGGVDRLDVALEPARLVIGSRASSNSMPSSSRSALWRGLASFSISMWASRATKLPSSRRASGLISASVMSQSRINRASRARIGVARVSAEPVTPVCAITCFAWKSEGGSRLERCPRLT